MLFMLKMDVTLPPDMPQDEMGALRDAEFARARQLVESGVLVRMWRIVGRVANYSVWDAGSHDELHQAVMSLPMFKYTKVEVTPLADHPNTEMTEARNGKAPPRNS